MKNTEAAPVVADVIDIQLKRIARFELMIKTAQITIDKFQARFAEDPHHALTWAQDTFKQVSAARVYAEVKRALEKGRTKEEVVNFAQDTLRQRASSPSFSTSVTSNLVEQYETAAWAEVIEAFRWE